MQAHELVKHLTTDQRVTVAKIMMITFNSFEECKSEQEIQILFSYLTEKVKQQALNRLMTINNGFVEQVPIASEASEVVTEN